MYTGPTEIINFLQDFYNRDIAPHKATLSHDCFLFQVPKLNLNSKLNKFESKAKRKKEMDMRKLPLDDEPPL